MKTVVVLIAILIVVFAGYFLYREFLENSLISDNSTSDICQVDSDCVCESTNPDGCGKPGQELKCVDNKCRLGFFDMAADNLINNEVFCELGNDCTPIVFECGLCPDYSMAINKDYYAEYIQQYQIKCSGNLRICASEPNGTSECVDNQCVLSR